MVRIAWIAALGLLFGAGCNSQPAKDPSTTETPAPVSDVGEKVLKHGSGAGPGQGGGSKDAQGDKVGAGGFKHGSKQGGGAGGGSKDGSGKKTAGAAAHGSGDGSGAGGGDRSGKGGAEGAKLKPEPAPE